MAHHSEQRSNSLAPPRNRPLQFPSRNLPGRRPIPPLLAVILAVVGTIGMPPAQTAETSQQPPSSPASPPPNLLTPPNGAGPVLVNAAFEFRELSDIDDQAETFQFTGLLHLTWKDERQAFDPAVTGAQEVVFQGSYQFNELAPAWYPEVALANAAGMYE